LHFNCLSRKLSSVGEIFDIYPTQHSFTACFYSIDLESRVFREGDCMRKSRGFEICSQRDDFDVGWSVRALVQKTVEI